MSDDLVKRLRKLDYCESTWGLLDEAADRIEKLEAALLDVIDNFFDGARICEIARKALDAE